MATEGIVEPDVQIKFDYNSGTVPQPTDLFDLGVIIHLLYLVMQYLIQ